MITIPLDSNAATPMYLQIYEHIKQNIINGILSNGTKLPSTRNLASHLFVSRNTVELGYEQLLSEGYIESRQRSGYYVCFQKQMSDVIPPAPSSKEKKAAIPDTRTDLKETDVSYRFSPFDVDISHFPFRTWNQLSKNSLYDAPELFLSGDHQGDPAFRKAIADYLYHSRGVNCQPEQIIIGAGVDYLLLLLSRIFPSHATIAMENPAYVRAEKILSGQGFSIRPIPLDEHGMSVDRLNDSDADIAYVTPSHQYPLGIVMPIQRRMELLKWARQKEARFIIEDDHDSEFRYKGKPIPSLQGYDTCQKVIYIGTFSKAIAPAIRISYMVLPDSLYERYQKNCNYFSCSVSRVDQAILTAFLTQGYFERHVNRMRKIYKAKHDCMLSALKKWGYHYKIEGENAGLHLVLHFHTSASEQELIDTALANGIQVFGLSPHCLVPISRHPKEEPKTLLLGYANLSESEIEEGIRQLFQCYKKAGY
ncbi:MAG: PLP-dependent aminotransferase family protein [Clostridiales bacterium]|nr:PLP-dependent aminotransferase family protein [Clostridiales bacterium]